MNETIDWTDELKSTAKIHVGEPSKLVSDYIDASRSLPGLLESMGIADSWGAKSNAEKRIASKFYSAWLARSFPLIDLTFAKVKANLLIERDTSEAKIVSWAHDVEPNTMQRVVSISRYAVQEKRGIDGGLGDAQAELGRVTFAPQHIDKVRRVGIDRRIVCNRPTGAPAGLRMKMNDVRASLVEASAAVIRAGGSIDAADARTTIVWKPKYEHISLTSAPPVNDDPAVLVTLGESCHHLVGFWDSPDEDPIENLIREFASGDLKLIRSA